MKHKKLTATTLTLLCIFALAGCGSSQTGQAARDETTVYEQTADTANGEKTDTFQTSDKNATNFDELMKSSLLRGSVADFEEGSFQVIPDQEDADMTISAANGMESGREHTTVSYGDDCTFWIAHVDSSTGAVELENADASSVKKSMSVCVYGETQDQGEIHATKVVIIRFDDQEG